MRTSETELMELFCEVIDLMPQSMRQAVPKPDGQSYFTEPDDVLREPPVSLEQVLGNAKSLSGALITILEDAGDADIARIVSKIDEFLKLPKTDLFSRRSSHHRLLDYVYTVV